MNNQIGWNSIYLDQAPTDTSITIVRNAVAYATRCSIGAATLEDLKGATNWVQGQGGPYATARDLAILQFSFSDTSTAEISVAGPKAECFLPSSREVDPQGPLADLIAAILLYGRNSLGSPAVSFLGGWRDKVPFF